jgi:hypothetical protein
MPTKTRFSTHRFRGKGRDLAHEGGQPAGDTIPTSTWRHRGEIFAGVDRSNRYREAHQSAEGRKRVNCRSFRRQLLTDPQHLTAAHQAHAAKCAPCARALRRAQAFEACLYSALLLECAAGRDRAWEPVVARGVHREP